MPKEPDAKRIDIQTGDHGVVIFGNNNVVERPSPARPDPSAQGVTTGPHIIRVKSSTDLPDYKLLVQQVILVVDLQREEVWFSAERISGSAGRRMQDQYLRYFYALTRRAGEAVHVGILYEDLVQQELTPTKRVVSDGERREKEIDEVSDPKYIRSNILKPFRAWAGDDQALRDHVDKLVLSLHKGKVKLALGRNDVVAIAPDGTFNRAVELNTDLASDR
jgi:hypothetical protein